MTVLITVIKMLTVTETPVDDNSYTDVFVVGGDVMLVIEMLMLMLTVLLLTTTIFFIFPLFLNTENIEDNLVWISIIFQILGP